MKLIKIINLIIVITVVSYIVMKHPEQARIRIPLLAGDIHMPTYLLIFLSFFIGVGFATLLYGKTIWQLRRKLKKSGYNALHDHDEKHDTDYHDRSLSTSKDIAIE